ncbi:hypothetical protein HUU39_14180 [candidate division KSB1 bacterium]|nr:hypothetical protein [bacterium]NUM66399.1 hypothetical protein [candidate division KSB1 bacterium]
MHENRAARTHATAAAIAAFGIAVREREILHRDRAVLNPKNARGPAAANGEIGLAGAEYGHIIGDHQKITGRVDSDGAAHAGRINNIRAGVRIGVENRLPQRTGTGVVGVGYGVRRCCQRQRAHAHKHEREHKPRHGTGKRSPAIASLFHHFVPFVNQVEKCSVTSFHAGILEKALALASAPGTVSFHDVVAGVLY